MYKAIVDMVMRIKEKYESSSKILCWSGVEVCDLMLIGSMTREFRRIRIDPFSLKFTQEFTILELVHAVTNPRLTFCDEFIVPNKDLGRICHRVRCHPQRGLRGRMDRLVDSCEGLDLSIVNR